MKKYTITIGVCVLACAASIFVFYGFGSRRNPCDRVVPEPANIGLLKQDVKKYHESGQWDDSIACHVEKAKAILQDYVPGPQEKPAVVFDIDDTALSNWEFILLSDFGYSRGKYKEWENSAHDTAIKPVLSLYTFAQLKGYAVFLITGRREDQREPTERNLKNVGFTNWQGVFFKPMEYAGNKAMEFKTKWRAYIESLGYTIVLNIGDQWSDLEGDPQARYNLKIANPAYFIP